MFEEHGFTHEFTFEDGVIGKEFAEQLQTIRAEEEQRRTKELVESQKLIEAIQLEEFDDNNSGFLSMQKKLEADIEQQKKDEELAKKLQQELESPSSSRVIVTRNSPRNVNKMLNAKRTKGPRQMTLEETMLSRKRKRDDS